MRAAMERRPYQRPRRSAALPCVVTAGCQPVLRGGVKRRFLGSADSGGVELCESEALGTKVFQRRADEIKLLVVDDEEAVVEGFVVAHGEFRVLRVEGRDVGGRNLRVGHMLFVVML